MDPRSAKPRLPHGPPAAAEGGPAEAPRAGGGGARDELCRLLRAQRDRASLSIEQISRVTRIPEPSLRLLEAGQFDELPGDVFVRGFLRSYARCVGLDADDVVRRYAECGGVEPAPVASGLAAAAAAEAAAARDGDDGAEVVRRPGGAGTSAAAGTGSGSVAGTGSVAGAGSGSGSGRETGDRQQATGNRQQATGSGAAPGKRRSRRHKDRQRHSSHAGKRRATPDVARRERADREPRRVASWRSLSRWRPSVLTIAVAVLVIAALATMSQLLRRPEGSAPRAPAGSSSQAP